MINVKHPIEELNRNQQNFIDSLPDDQKDYHSLLFSYGNAAYRYYNLKVEPTKEDYDEWLQGLEGHFKIDMERNGFENCKSILSFARYVREKRDIGLEDFILDVMGKKDYENFKKLT